MPRLGYQRAEFSWFRSKVDRVKDTYGYYPGCASALVLSNRRRPRNFFNSIVTVGYMDGCKRLGHGHGSKPMLCSASPTFLHLIR